MAHKCSNRCGNCCDKWQYPRKYHSNPWKFINDLKKEGATDQIGVKFIPHPKYKTYLTCAYLDKKLDGTSLCSIYRKRPTYCAKFYCTNWIQNFNSMVKLKMISLVKKKGYCLLNYNKEWHEGNKSKNRRAGIEPRIGHLKLRGLGKSRMKSDIGDLISGNRSALSYNLALLMRDMNLQVAN